MKFVRIITAKATEFADLYELEIECMEGDTVMTLPYALYKSDTNGMAFELTRALELWDGTIEPMENKEASS